MSKECTKSATHVVQDDGEGRVLHCQRHERHQRERNAQERRRRRHSSVAGCRESRNRVHGSSPARAPLSGPSTSPWCGYSIRQTVTARERKVQVLQLFSDCSQLIASAQTPEFDRAFFRVPVHSRASQARKYRMQDTVIQLLVLATTEHPTKKEDDKNLRKRIRDVEPTL